MLPLVAAAIQAAPSVGQLLIGENSLFSGKKRLASRELKKNFDASQAAGINKGYYDVLGQQAARANQGMGGASLGLARMEQGRAMAAQLGALGGRRSALAGLPGLGISSNDFALRLAASNEMAQRQNQAAYEGTQLQVAGLEDQNAQRKRDEAASYWGAQRQESDQSISSAVEGISKALGTAFMPGVPGAGAAGKAASTLGQELKTAAVSSIPSMASLGLNMALPKKTYGAPLLGVTPRASASQKALSNSLLMRPTYGGL
jgi:hypothetical protein